MYSKDWFKPIFPIFLTPKVHSPLPGYVLSLLTVPTTVRRGVNGAREQEGLVEKLTIKENVKDTNDYHLKARNA
jgi:hypothetical protein